MNYLADDNERAASIKKSGRNAAWKNKYGQYTKVRYMKTDYIINLIEWIKQKEDYIFSQLWKSWVTVLNQELIKRKKEWRR